MDPATQSTVIIIAAAGAQLVVIIAAVFAGIAARDARRIALDTKVETQTQTATINAVAKDTAVVLGHVNSEKAKDSATIEYQAKENQLLRDHIQEQSRVAGLLAQRVATRPLEDGKPLDVKVVEQPEPPRPDATGPVDVNIVPAP